MGWEKVIINIYERGSLPSKKHSDFFKIVINNKSIFEETLEKAYEEKNINGKTYNKIKETLKNTN